MKNLIIILLLLLPVLKINAQEVFETQTMLGINGGMSASQVFFSPSVSQIPIYGYNGGLVFKHISEPHLGIQLELNYAQKGWEESLDSGKVYRRNLAYIELPFMSHIELGKRSTKFLINIGPTFSYLFSDDTTKILIDKKSDLSYYNSKINSKLELGLCFGLGIIESTGIGDFQLEARFYQGINNLFTIDRTFSYSTNQVLAAKLSYLFNFSRRYRSDSVKE